VDKLTIAVCPHDTAKRPERWFALAQYLNRSLDQPFQFSQAMDFAEFHESMHTADLVYANPQDALRLLHDHGFIPLSRAVNLFDEVVFIANAEAPADDLAALSGEPLATVASMLPTQIALKVLADQGIEPGEVRSQPSWLAVLNHVHKGHSRFGLLYRDFFEDLNKLSKSTVQVIDRSEEHCAFHMFMLSPAMAHIADVLANVLAGMSDDPRGREVLDDLQMSRLALVEEDDWDRIQQIRERYG